MVKFLVHHYDRETHEYLRSGLDANENPKHLGQAMIPADATTKMPPQTGEHQKAVFVKSGALPDAGEWEVKADYRGVVYYNKETQEETKLALGEEPNDTLTELKPEADQVWDETVNGWVIPLETARQKKNDEIRYIRWQTEEQGTVTYAGLAFPTDSASQGKLNSAKALAQEGLLAPAWQAKDGVLTITDVQQLIDLGLLVGRFVEAQFLQQFSLLSQLANATTREEIEAIVWPGPAPLLPETNA